MAPGSWAVAPYPWEEALDFFLRHWHWLRIFRDLAPDFLGGSKILTSNSEPTLKNTEPVSINPEPVYETGSQFQIFEEIYVIILHTRV